MITLRPYQTEAAHQLVRLLMDHRVAYLRDKDRRSTMDTWIIYTS